MDAMKSGMAMANAVCDQLISDHLVGSTRKAPRPTMTVEIEVTVTVPVEVWGETPPYYPQTEYEPAEGGKFEVQNWGIEPSFDLESMITTEEIETAAREALDEC